MAPPDMTRASDTQDQEEGSRRPGNRGWFQPMGPAAAAANGDDGEETNPFPTRRPDGDGQGAGTGSGDKPAQVPDETTVFARILAADAAEDELPTADQAPVVRPAAQDSGSGLPEASETGASPADAGTS